jgi:hypothetical protein
VRNTTRRLLCGLAAAIALAGAAAARSTDERPIQGGTFEASGVVHVPGTSSVLFVDDSREDAVLSMELDAAGRQRAPATAVPWNARVVDPEGITTDGTWFYVVGSQSKRNSASGVGLLRFRYDAASRRVSNVESVSGIRQALLQQLPSIAAAAGNRTGGFNIEGLAWDAAQRRLLLGLRTPSVGGDAVIIPLAVAADRPLGPAILETAESDLIRLPLENSGVRSMEFDSRQSSFYVIAADDDDSGPFRLWRWAGGAGRSAKLQVVTQFDARLKPEGVSPAGARTLLVFDTSKYLAID